MRKSKLLKIAAVAILLIVGSFLLLYGRNFQVLNSKGYVADRERNLLIFTVLLSLLVVVPIFTMTAAIAYKYRASNHKAKYSPNWDHNVAAEFAWWAIPSVIILVLSIVTWNSSHSLDPYKPIADKTVAPLDIQVIALDWKWLFIYPAQHVASVNLMEFPVNTPLNLDITSDAPMNSFWVPQLGGQIYAMPGMVTQLHLMANQSGDYHGSSANISGAGFAGMDFIARATSSASFNGWVSASQNSKLKLNSSSYATLVKNSQNNPVQLYNASDPNIFDAAVSKYMMPAGSSMNMSTSMEGM